MGTSHVISYFFLQRAWFFLDFVLYEKKEKEEEEDEEK